MYYSRNSGYVGSTSKMREERRSEQILPQIQIKNVVSSSTRGVLEKDGENQIIDKKVFNYFCMFSILHIESKLKNNFFSTM